MVTQHFVQRLSERHCVNTPETIQILTSELEDRINNVDESVTLLDDSDFPLNHFRVEMYENVYRVVYNVIDKVLITVLPNNPPKKKEWPKLKPIKTKNSKIRCNTMKYLNGKAARKNNKHRGEDE
jgi:hypothetical protein